MTVHPTEVSAEHERLVEDLNAAIEARHRAAHTVTSIFECTDHICSALAALITAVR